MHYEWAILEFAMNSNLYWTSYYIASCAMQKQHERAMLAWLQSCHLSTKQFTTTFIVYVIFYYDWAKPMALGSPSQSQYVFMLVQNLHRLYWYYILKEVSNQCLFIQMYVRWVVVVNSREDIFHWFCSKTTSHTCHAFHKCHSELTFNCLQL